MRALTTGCRTGNQGERQAKIDLPHSDRDRKNHARPVVENDICERRIIRAVVSSAGNELAQPNQRIADIGVRERILAPDKFDDVPVRRNLKAFVRYVNKESQLFNRNLRSLSGLSTTERRSKAFVCFFDRENLGIEMSDPLLHILVLFVIGVGEGFEKFFVRKGASDVLRRRTAFAAYAQGTDTIVIAMRHFLKPQYVQPLVAVIVGIVDLITDGDIQVAQANAPVVYKLMLSIGIGNAINAASEVEIVQVTVLPVHDGLNDPMELGQREVSGYEDPSPDRRFCASNSKVELKDLP